jgi:hypothetical protein
MLKHECTARSDWKEDTFTLQRVKYMNQFVRIGKTSLCAQWVQPHEPVNVLTRSYEDAGAVVSARWDRRPLLCEVVPIVVGRPKQQEPAENDAIARRSRGDRSALLPWLGCMGSRHACGSVTPDAANRNGRDCRSGTSPSQGSLDAGRQVALCASKKPGVLAWWR